MTHIQISPQIFANKIFVIPKKKKCRTDKKYFKTNRERNEIGRGRKMGEGWKKVRVDVKVKREKKT